jgi:ribosome biogenesis GTPase A
MEKTAVTFLTEYRAGTIGRISLETPLSRKAMIDALIAKPADTATEEEPEQE